jgi:hypothetical protein
MIHHSGDHLGLLWVLYNPVILLLFGENDIRFHFARFASKPKMTNASVTKNLKFYISFFSSNFYFCYLKKRNLFRFVHLPVRTRNQEGTIPYKILCRSVKVF